MQGACEHLGAGHGRITEVHKVGKVAGEEF